MKNLTENNQFAKLGINLLLVTLTVYMFWIQADFWTFTTCTLSVILCSVIEMFVHYLEDQHFRPGSISLATWLMVGLAMNWQTPWWIFALIACVAIALKTLATVRGRSYFNPAALGIFLAVFLFKGKADWKMSHAWFVLVPAGCYFAYLTGKLEILAGYLGASLPLLAVSIVRKGLTWDTLANWNCLFAFIMLIDPQTSPGNRWPKVFYGAGIALLGFLLAVFGFRWEPYLLALLIFNGLTPLLDKIDWHPALKKPSRV